MGGGIRAFCPKCGKRLKKSVCFKCGWVSGKEEGQQKQLIQDKKIEETRDMWC